MLSLLAFMLSAKARYLITGALNSSHTARWTLHMTERVGQMQTLAREKYIAKTVAVASLVAMLDFGPLGS